MVLVNDSYDLFAKYRVINFSGSNFVSNAIKKITSSHWAHSGIIVDVMDADIKLLESRAHGPEVNTYSKSYLVERYEQKSVEVIDFGIDELVKDEVWEPYLEGYGYGFESMVAIFVRSLGVPIKFDAANTVICSELVAKVLYDLSDKKVRLGHDPNKEGWSEFNIPYWQVEPKMVSLSHYGDRVVSNRYLLD